MKIVQLQDLHIEAFKGVAKFELIANGQNVSIFGDNATGKTTIADAINWLLFDKDSHNRKDFAIKTLDADGNEINHLDHTVQATFIVDGAPTTLRKLFREKWTQKRGAATKEFSGHETKYYIDEVPAKKKDYDAAVDSIIPENLFKLLTNPFYFSEQMKWQDQRALLVEIAGNVTDQEVAAGRPELTQLLDALEGKSFNDYKKIVAERKKTLNTELKEIPIRINEAQKQLVPATDSEPLKAELADIEKAINELNETIFNIKNGGVVATKQQELAQVTAELTAYKSEFSANSNEELYKLQVRYQEEQSNLLNLQRPAHDLDVRIGNCDKSHHEVLQQIVKTEQERAALLATYKTEKAVEFTYEDTCTCPTCKQNLPQEQLDAARQTALEAFNLAKSQKLDAIVTKGKELAQGIESLKNAADSAVQTLNGLRQEFSAASEKVVAKQQELEKLDGKLQALQASAPRIEEDARYIELTTKQRELNENIEQLTEHALEASLDVENEKMELVSRKREIDAQLAQMANMDVLQKRIDELKEQETLLVQQYQQIEQKLFQVEEFTRLKVDMLQERINSKFADVTFKLFEDQINGGLNEVCEALYNGVPFSKGLNNAARINAGIDIINTLSARYGVQAPLVIDNAEAVTKLIDTPAQCIRLVVSEQDKALRVEDAKSSVFATSGIELTADEYAGIQKRLDFLDALEAAGVDNWRGYDYAYEILEENESEVI